MSDTFRVVGGPPIVLDDGRVVRFGETFDLDELADDTLLNLLLDSGQVGFVIPAVDAFEGDPPPEMPPTDGGEG